MENNDNNENNNLLEKLLKNYFLITFILTVIIIVASIAGYNSKVNKTKENLKVNVNEEIIKEKIIKEEIKEIEKQEEIIEEPVKEEVIEKEIEDVKYERIFDIDEYPIVDASLAIHPLANSIASNFLDLDLEDLHYEYTKSRSSEVYRKIIDGETDIAIAAPISTEDEEYAASQNVELDITPLTSSAFVFIVNTSNPVDNLTLDEVRKIYSGEITNWKEVGGNDEEIVAYQRPNGSGSQTAMMNLVMNQKDLKMAPTIQVEEEMGGLIDVIAEYDNCENAIGYSYFYYVNTMYKKDTIKMLSIDGVYPSIESIKENKYPLYTNGFLVKRTDNEKENVLKWIDNVLSDRGNKIIEENGYVKAN